MKEMTSVATTMMSEEEKAELEKEMNGGATPPATVSSEATTPTPGIAEPTPAPSSSSLHAADVSSTPASGALTPSPLPSPAGEGQEDKSLHARSPTKDKKKSKLTPEQRQKLQELELERRKNMEERVETLYKKLIDRLRPFVEAKNPGALDDPETKTFEERMRREADDLKLESFGVEVRVPSLRHLSMLTCAPYSFFIASEMSIS